ncbi:MAG TPA: ATP-binding protein [Coleofasciculaceae cyanobacterium]
MESNRQSLSSTLPSKKVQILVVEDEYIIAENLRENLESLGYSVSDTASSAIEAIEKAEELQPDIVLMDIRLQGEMDGIQAAEQIWNRLQIPVIYITGHSDRSTLERAKVTFPFGYILKPVKEQEVYVAIETALNRYEREQFLSTVLRRIGDGVIVVDTRYQIKYLNRVAEIFTGWQLNEARDQDLMTVLNLVDEETRQPVENPAISAFRQDSVVYLNRRVLLITKDGTTFPVTDSVASLMDKRGNLTGAVLVFRNDTQRRLQEEYSLALQRAQLMEQQMAELQRLDKLKDDFLSTVSHELRTPLTVIEMAIQMLEISLDRRMLVPSELEADAAAQQVEQYLKILREQCEYELNLVNDLLELQHLGAEEIPVNPAPINLLDWIPHIVEAFQEHARTRQQHLQVLLPPVLPLLVSDIPIFTRILKELLTNACKYTPLEGVITVSAQQVEEHLELMVSNSGIEIPPEELPRIFDKFHRLPTSDHWNQGGTGLGLALIKKLVIYLGGNIWAESRAGQTCFIVELPLSSLVEFNQVMNT